MKKGNDSSLTKLQIECRTLSDRMIASLIHNPRYIEIEKAQLAFVDWCDEHPNSAETWQDAWKMFYGIILS